MVVVGQLGRAPDALERIAQPRARRARRRRRRAAARRLRRALRALADDVARGEAERAVGDVAREVRLREEPLLQVRHVARVRELDEHGREQHALDRRERGAARERARVVARGRLVGEPRDLAHEREVAEHRRAVGRELALVAVVVLGRRAGRARVRRVVGRVRVVP